MLQEVEEAEQLPSSAAAAAANVSGIMSNMGFDSLELTNITGQVQT